MSGIARSIASPIARPIASPLSGGGGGGTPLTLSVSDESPVDGETITFTFSGPSGTHLYLDGVWVAGGNTSPYVARVGPVDSGLYTAGYWDADTFVQTDAIAVAVAENNAVTEDFGSATPSADWSAVTGSPVITGGSLEINYDASGSHYLSKSVVADNVRFALTLNLSELTSGIPIFLSLIGSDDYPIVSAQAISSTSLRISPSVAGWYWGAEKTINYATSYNQINDLSGDQSLEIRWDHTTDSAWIYLNGKLLASYINAIVNDPFSPKAAKSIAIGKLDGEAGSGKILIKDFVLKSGNAASTPYGEGSRVALFHGLGQSNMAGADTGSYSAITDDIGPHLRIDSGTNDESGTNAQPTQTAISSTSVQYGFVQGIDLPATYQPMIVNAGIGSTDFTSDPGWADAVGSTGLYRHRAMFAAEHVAACVERKIDIAIQFQGFEGAAATDTTAYQSQLGSLINQYRTAIGDASCPFITGGFSPAYLAGGEIESAAFIATEAANDLLSDAFASSTQPTALTYQPTGGNRIHFDAAGYRALGARYAEQYLILRPAAKPTP